IAVLGDPCPRRRPSTSTSVRFGPSPRKSAVATPPGVVKPLVVLPRSCPSPLFMFCGNCVMRSLISVLPVVSMDSDDMTSIGLVLTAFGAAMREPVTMISCRGSSVAATLACCCAKADTLAAAAKTATKSCVLQAEKKWVRGFYTPKLMLHMLRVSLRGNGHDVSDQKRAFRCGITTIRLMGLIVCGPKNTRRAIQREKM